MCSLNAYTLAFPELKSQVSESPNLHVGWLRARMNPLNPVIIPSLDVAEHPVTMTPTNQTISIPLSSLDIIAICMTEVRRVCNSTSLTEHVPHFTSHDYSSLCNLCALQWQTRRQTDVRWTSARRMCTEIRSLHISLHAATQSGYGAKQNSYLDHDREREQEPQPATPVTMVAGSGYLLHPAHAGTQTLGLLVVSLPEGCFYWKSP